MHSMNINNWAQRANINTYDGDALVTIEKRIPQAHGSETLFCNGTQDAYWLNNPSAPNPFWNHHATHYNIQLQVNVATNKKQYGRLTKKHWNNTKGM